MPRVYVVSKTVSIPSGISEQQTLTVDFSEDVPIGCNLIGVRLGSYILPYIQNGTAKTWVDTYNNGRVLTIRSSSAAWNNYTLVATFIK